MSFCKGSLPALIAAGLCLLVSLDAARGQSEPAVRLPGNPAQWINSPPLSLRSLRGKGVVLYFFEEG